MGRTVRKSRDAEPATKLSRSDLKQKIRALKKERAAASERAAKSKVQEFNQQLKVYRRMLRRQARHKA